MNPICTISYLSYPYFISPFYLTNRLWAQLNMDIVLIVCLALISLYTLPTSSVSALYPLLTLVIKAHFSWVVYTFYNSDILQRVFHCDHLTTACWSYYTLMWFFYFKFMLLFVSTGKIMGTNLPLILQVSTWLLSCGEQPVRALGNVCDRRERKPNN